MNEKKYIYTNKAKRNFVCLFACVFVWNGRPCPVWNGLPALGIQGVTFDVKNDRPGPGSLRGHFEGRPRPFF